MNVLMSCIKPELFRVLIKNSRCFIYQSPPQKKRSHKKYSIHLNTFPLIASSDDAFAAK